MIYLLDLDKETKLMDPVTTSDIVVGKGTTNFHPEGLFSEKIFGPKDSDERKNLFSYIDLHCKVLHPSLIKPIYRLNRKILQAIDREAIFSMGPEGNLIEDKDGDINGISSIMVHFEKIMSKKEEDKTRKDIKNMVMNYWKNDMLFIDKCIVIPAFYRDAELDEEHGSLRIKPINDYYTKIIKHSIQMDSMSLTEGPMYDILAAKMQQLLNELYDYIIKKVSKKEGLVRQNLLGKRVDYSGSAVITGAASEVKVDEIGIPFRMLVKLFEPFIIYDIHNSKNTNQDKFAKLVEEYNGETFSIPSTRRLFSNIDRGFYLPEELEEMIKASINRAIKDKVVLAKRDPALHAESVQAFKPKMMDGNTIKLNPLKCAAYNADFDGDSINGCIRIVYGKQKKEFIGHISELEDLEI